MDENMIYLYGEMKEEKEDWRICIAGIPPPCCVDSNKIKLKFKDGNLRLTLPKAEEVKRKRVEVGV